MTRGDDMNNDTAEQTAKKVSGRPFKSGALWTGNRNGRPKGAISLITDIKRKLLWMKKHDEKKYDALIDDYIQDKKKRELLLKSVDPQINNPLEGAQFNQYNIKIITEDNDDRTQITSQSE